MVRRLSTYLLLKAGDVASTVMHFRAEKRHISRNMAVTSSRRPVPIASSTWSGMTLPGCA